MTGGGSKEEIMALVEGARVGSIVERCLVKKRKWMGWLVG